MYARDPHTKVVINTDDGYYKAIVARRMDKQKTAKLENELEEVRSELCEIKALLQQVLNGKKYG